MAVERDERGVEAAGVGELAHEPQHLLVALVHAVVRADRDDAAVAQRREAVDLAHDPGGGHPAILAGHEPAHVGRRQHDARLEPRAAPLVDREERPGLVDDRVRTRARRPSNATLGNTEPCATARADSASDGRPLEAAHRLDRA